MFMETADYQRGFHAAKEECERELELMRRVYESDIIGRYDAEAAMQEGVRPGELDVQIIKMLKGALFQARNQTVLAGRLVPAGVGLRQRSSEQTNSSTTWPSRVGSPTLRRRSASLRL